MSTIKKLLLISIIALLIVAMLMGCARMFWNPAEQEGGYIRLNVGHLDAKGIDVDYQDVTRLSITVYDPGDAELATFEWDAEDGPQSYLVQVNTTGTYRLSVTHISDDDGEAVEATETVEFEIEAMVITVINITPGVIGMIEVEGDNEQEEIDMTGYWAGFAYTPEGEEGPHLIYFVQTGTILEGYDGEGPFTGTVDGTDVTIQFYMDDQLITMNGTVQEDGQVLADFGRMEPLEFTCGSFVLEGIVELDSPCGLGADYGDRIWHRLDFDVQADPLYGQLMFQNDFGLSPGEYPVNENNTMGFVFTGPGNEWPAEGTLLIEDGPSVVNGSFDLSFEGEDYLVGTFALDYPNSGGATVTVSEGRWGDVDVLPGTSSGLWWEQSTSVEKGSIEIRHLDEDLDVWFGMTPSETIDISEGPFLVPDEISVRVSWSKDDGTNFEEEALAGTLFITYEADGDGIAGHFGDMVFPSGLLSGSFDVKYEISYME